MRLSFRLDLVCIAALMTGCAVGSGNSYVAPLEQPADTETLANDIAAFVAMRLPAASSTVALDPTPLSQVGNADALGDIRRNQAQIPPPLTLQMG